MNAANVYGNALNNNQANAASITKNELQAKVYPNPAHDFCTVQVSGTFNQPILLTPIDVNGNIRITQMLHSNTEKLKLDGLPAGSYILKAGTEQEHLSFKIVKQ